MVSAYGMGIIPGELDYETYCSLWLNIQRIRLQRAWDIKTGLQLSKSRGTIPLSVYAAQAITPELAPILQYRGNKARYVADQKAKLGFHE